MMMRDSFGPPLWFIVPFVLIFVAVISAFVYVIGKSISTSVRNRQAPFLEREARVVSRRQHVWGDNASTYYYVTFEFPDGSREELQLRGEEYGLLAEGDTGRLRSQGTWFKGFERVRI